MARCQPIVDVTLLGFLLTTRPQESFLFQPRGLETWSSLISTWLRQVEGFCLRVGTNRERAWALAKEDALAYRVVGGARLR